VLTLACPAALAAPSVRTELFPILVQVQGRTLAACLSIRLALLECQPVCRSATHALAGGAAQAASVSPHLVRITRGGMQREPRRPSCASCKAGGAPARRALSLEHCRRVTFVPDGLLVLTGLAGVASLNLQARREQGGVPETLGQPDSFSGLLTSTACVSSVRRQTSHWTTGTAAFAAA